MDSSAKAWRFQAFEREADHGEPHEGGDGSCVAFEIARQSSIAADPGEGLRQDHETMEIAGPAISIVQHPAAAIVVAIFGP